MKSAINALCFSLLFVPILLAPAGCNQNTGGTLGNANGRAEALEEDLVDSATEADALATRLAIEVKAGRKATPKRYAEALSRWHGVEILIESLQAFGQRFVKFSQDVVVIKSNLAQAAKERADMIKQLDKANSKGTKNLRAVQLISVIGIGALVGLGFLLHDFKLPAVGIAGAGAAIATAQVVIGLQNIPTGYILAGGGVMVAGFVWLMVEWWARGSFTEALKTNPFQDIRDILRSHGGTGKGIATVTTEEGTVAVSGEASGMGSVTPST